MALDPKIRDQLARRAKVDPGLPVPNPTISFWQKPHPNNIAHQHSEVLPTHRDVLIIGSGITGCSVARWLLAGNRELSVSILEARTLCSGATGRNGGHIKCTPVTDYPRLRQSLGHEAAAKIIRFVMMHYESILQAAKELGVDEIGEVRPVTAATVVLDRARVTELRDAHNLFEKAFPEFKGRYKFYNREEAQQLLGLRCGYAAMTGPAGAAWPYRLITAIYRSLLTSDGDRFSVETSTPVLHVKSSADQKFPYHVQTSRGPILARNVVYCAEAHTTHLLPRLRGYIIPRVGQMTVQKSDVFPLERSRFSWSFLYKNSFDYMCQNAQTGEIFLGGGSVVPDEDDYGWIANPADDSESIMCRIHLKGVVSTIFGGSSPEIKATWSGVMGDSLDGLPLVGRLPTSASEVQSSANETCGEWIAAGFGGYGMVNSWLSGRALAEMILSKDVPQWFPGSYLVDEKRMKKLGALLSSFQDGTLKSLL